MLKNIEIQNVRRAERNGWGGGAEEGMLGDRRGILHHSHVPTTMWWPSIGHQLPMIPRKIQENPRVQNSSLLTHTWSATNDTQESKTSHMSPPHFGLLLFKWRQDDFYKLANNVHLFFSGLFTFPTQHIITISSLFCLSLVTNSSPFTFTSPYSLVTSNLSPTPVFTPGVTLCWAPHKSHQEQHKEGCHHYYWPILPTWGPFRG